MKVKKSYLLIVGMMTLAAAKDMASNSASS